MAKSNEEPRAKQVSWRISEELRRRINIRAQQERKTAEALVIEWLEEKLRQAEGLEEKRRRESKNQSQ